MRSFKNKKKLLLFLLIVSMLTLVGWSGDLLTSTKRGVNKIVFLHTNDMHGEINNFGKIAKEVEELKKEYGRDNVFLVSAGDLFSGNAVVDQYDIISRKDDKKGYPMIDLMNQVGYDLSVIGNHDFDYGQSILNKRIKQADFPIICANLNSSKAVLREPNAYQVLGTTAGVKIVLLGLVQIGENKIPATNSNKVAGIEFFNELKSARRYTYLAEESDIFVVLSHLGNDKDEALAQAMGDLDLIIGGHSHTVIKDPYQVNGVLITQAGADGEYLGKIVITLKDGKIIDKEAELISLVNLKETDFNIESSINRYNKEREEVFNKNIAVASNPINGKDELGSLMADAIRDEDDLDFAFQNNGGVRLDILEGRITLADIYELDPFGNKIVKFKMTTDEIKSLIKYSYKKSSTIDLQVSGLKYIVVIDDLGTLRKVELEDYQGNLLNENKEYTVGLNSYIASNYEFEGKSEGSLLEGTSAKRLINYLKKQEIIDYSKLKGRTGIKVIDDGEDMRLFDDGLEINSNGKMIDSTSAGNLMADAVKRITGVDIGSYPSKSLGNISVEIESINRRVLRSLYSSFKYKNRIDIVRLSGADVERVLLAQSRYYKGAPLQVSGISYEVIKDDDKIIGIKVYMDGRRIDRSKEYTIGLNSYYSKYYKEAAGKVIDSTLTERTEEEILIEYLNRLKDDGKNIIDLIKEDRIDTI